jgi:predicted GNAT family acetyltransferase
MTIKPRPFAHSITISGVYTPSKYRCQECATAVVAHLSQRLLDSVHRLINPFTDHEKPTTDSIDQKIGCCPIYDL